MFNFNVHLLSLVVLLLAKLGQCCAATILLNAKLSLLLAPTDSLLRNSFVFA